MVLCECYMPSRLSLDSNVSPTYACRQYCLQVTPQASSHVDSHPNPDRMMLMSDAHVASSQEVPVLNSLYDSARDTLAYRTVIRFMSPRSCNRRCKCASGRCRPRQCSRMIQRANKYTSTHNQLTLSSLVMIFHSGKTELHRLK